MNVHKDSLSTLSEIFRKANLPAVPPRVSVRGVVQKKLQEVNQEGTKMIISPQSKTFTNAEHPRLPIVESYPGKFQALHLAKNPIFFTNQKREFNSYTKNWKIAKNDI